MLDIINTEAAFILYAKSEVLYDGRANSTLDKGNYLIIHKSDGSLLIHAKDKTTPRNYQSPGATLSKSQNVIISQRKKETIKIIIDEILTYSELNNWSEDQIRISKTEKDLVDKLETNPVRYFGIPMVKLLREYPNKYGKIDLFCIDAEDTNHVVEAKRLKATVNHCIQLHKYIEAIKEESDVNIIGYIAAPEIGSNALEYLEKFGYKFIKITFEDNNT